MDYVTSIWNQFAEYLGNVLPYSPFKPFLDEMENLPALGFLNWLIPVQDILRVMGAWLGAVAIFYLFSVVLRWLHVIGD